MVKTTAPTDLLPPRLGFGAALFLVIVADVLFNNLLGRALGSTPGAAAGLAILLVPMPLTVLFAWQLWRWINHKPSGGARGTASGAKVVPERLQQLRRAMPAVEAANELRPAHAPAPRPVVALAGAPDAPFLAHCAGATVFLAAELAAADGTQRAAMLKQLCEHHQLRWEAAAAGGAAAASDAEVPASFDAAARELAVPLAQGAFAWDVPPLRAGGEAVVARALVRLLELAEGNMDAARFGGDPLPHGQLRRNIRRADQEGEQRVARSRDRPGQPLAGQLVQATRQQQQQQQQQAQSSQQVPPKQQKQEQERQPHPYNNLGALLQKKGDLAGAEAAYLKAIEIDPRHVDAHSNLGVLLEKKGDLAGAEAAYLKAIEIDPCDAGAHLKLGAHLYERNNWAGAEKVILRVLEIDPANDLAKQFLPMIREEMRR